MQTHSSGACEGIVVVEFEQQQQTLVFFDVSTCFPRTRSYLTKIGFLLHILLGGSSEYARYAVYENIIG